MAVGMLKAPQALATRDTILFSSKIIIIQWNPSKADTIGTKNFVRRSEVSFVQGLVVDHVPPTIAASYDKALLWTMEKTILMRDLSTDSS